MQIYSSKCCRLQMLQINLQTIIMNFNVDRLWNQVLVEPEEVLKLIPPNSNHPVLLLLFFFAKRVRLQGSKPLPSEDYSKKIEGTTIANIFRIERMKKSLQLENKILEEESQLTMCFQVWHKKLKSQKDSQLIELLAFLRDQKMAYLRTSQLIHIFFLDCVVFDLLRMISQSKLPQKEFNSLIEQEKPIKLNGIDVQSLLKILDVSVPTVLHLAKLKQNQLPYSLKHQTKNILFLEKSLFWILRKSNKLAYFNKILVQALIVKDQLSFSQQLLVAKIVFRYFYAYHQQRKMMAVEILFQTYNKIDGAVRFALASQFSVLLKVAEKIGKTKMVQSMASKSKWIEELLAKRSTSQQSLPQEHSYQSCIYGETIILKPNEDTIRYFEIVDDYSILWVSISCQSEFQMLISWVNDFEGRQFDEVIVTNRKTKVFNEKIVIKKSGIYRLSISNGFSWITTKKIVYNLNVLSPVQLQATTSDTQAWKKSYISLGKYQDVPNSRVSYYQKTIDGEVHIYRDDSKYRFQIIPSKGSKRNSVEYETDNSCRFLQRIKSIFKEKSELLFLFKVDSQVERQIISLEELRELLESKVEKKQKKQKSIVIEIPIKKELL